MIPENKDIIPKFLCCYNYEQPDLSLIYHSQFPRLFVSVIGGYNEKDLLEVRNKNLIFTKVKLKDGQEDLLVMVNLIDEIDITSNQNFNKLHDTFDEMCEWHKNEVASLFTILQ